MGLINNSVFRVFLCTLNRTARLLSRAAISAALILPLPAAAQNFGQVLWGLQLATNPAPLVVFDGTQNVQFGTLDEVLHSFQITAPVNTGTLTVTGTATINNLVITGTESGGNILTGVTSPLQVSPSQTVSFINQSANTVLAGPTTGAAAAPAFRALVVADVANLLGAQVTATPTNPTGTTSTTGVMSGINTSITPTKSGQVNITIYGDSASSVSGDGCKQQLRISSVANQAAPANAAALTGTALGAATTNINNTATPFSLTWIVTGLTLNASWWIDVSEAAVTGGTCSLTNLNTVYWEY